MLYNVPLAAPHASASTAAVDSHTRRPLAAPGAASALQASDTDTPVGLGIDPGASEWADTLADGTHEADTEPELRLDPSRAALQVVGHRAGTREAGRRPWELETRKCWAGPGSTWFASRKTEGRSRADWEEFQRLGAEGSSAAELGPQWGQGELLAELLRWNWAMGSGQDSAGWSSCHRVALEGLLRAEPLIEAAEALDSQPMPVGGPLGAVEPDIQLEVDTAAEEDRIVDQELEDRLPELVAFAPGPRAARRTWRLGSGRHRSRRPSGAAAHWKPAEDTVQEELEIPAAHTEAAAAPMVGCWAVEDILLVLPDAEMCCDTH